MYTRDDFLKYMYSVHNFKVYVLEYRSSSTCTRDYEFLSRYMYLQVARRHWKYSYLKMLRTFQLTCAQLCIKPICITTVRYTYFRFHNFPLALYLLRSEIPDRNSQFVFRICKISIDLKKKHFPLQ